MRATPAADLWRELPRTTEQRVEAWLAPEFSPPPVHITANAERMIRIGRDIGAQQRHRLLEITELREHDGAIARQFLVRIHGAVPLCRLQHSTRAVEARLSPGTVAHRQGLTPNYAADDHSCHAREQGTVTIRDRDTMAQIRIPKDNVAAYVSDKMYTWKREE